ncbi:serine protease [Halanaerobium saccharolyticum]|uniref:Serine protease n=1 Tax=Halanaerobium saccharolyticum TaxID=43595 RepID=A0A4R6S7N2_9FIRM|nr:S8 family serine peptidase [Halanaerobium saccharolyticum]TDP95929.1 serine protease [Halanaerobium saccharolyticum]
MKKKFLILIAMLIVGGLVLSACSSGSSLGDNANISGTVITNHQRGYIEASSQSNSKSVQSMMFNSKGKKFVDNEIIVKYNDSVSVSSMTNEIAKSGSNALKKIRTDNGELVKIKIPSNKTVEEMVEYYSQQPGVEYAEPNYIAYAQAIPNDTYYEDGIDNNIGQWGLWATNMELAWDLQQTSNSYLVAVLDSGIIPDHEDLTTNLVSGVDFVTVDNTGEDPSDYKPTDFDPSDPTTESENGSHGTHVSGIIGALTDNNLGVAGINWETNILPVRVLKSDQTGSHYDIAEGIYYSVDESQAEIINMSFGGESSSNTLHNAVEYAYENGTIMIAASGNSGVDSVHYPAAYEETIAVGSIENKNDLADYSNYGAEIDLVAPGGDDTKGILSTWGYYDGASYNPGYAYMSGTSMSTAYVSGAAALLLESGVSPNNIKDRLISTAFDLGIPNKDDNYGHGMLDVYAALKNEKTKPPIVFVAEVIGDELVPVDNTDVEVNSEGEYAISERVEGQYYLVAWKNTNNNDSIDQGDYYGISPDPELEEGIYFQPGEMVKENIDMYYVYAETNASAPSISAASIEKLRD